MDASFSRKGTLEGAGAGYLIVMCRTDLRIRVRVFVSCRPMTARAGHGRVQSAPHPVVFRHPFFGQPSRKKNARGAMRKAG